MAPIVWSVTIGWFSPILSGISSGIITVIIHMGTALVDPFGTDIVDLPLNRFCETIEIQIHSINKRSKQPDLMNFAEFSSAKGLPDISNKNRRRNSRFVKLHMCEL
eukprot:12300604-Ditylum_brightwellii.AAC.1